MSKNKLLIFCIIGLFLFYFFFAVFSDIKEVIKSLTSMKLEYYPIILFFIVIGVIIKGIRQYYLLKFNELKISLKDSIVIFIAGLSLTFTPGGAGELIKTKFFRDKHGMQIRNTAPIVVMEKYHEFLGAITIILIGMVFYNSIPVKIALILGTVTLGIIYFNLRYKKLPQILKQFLSKIKPLRNIITTEEDSKKSFYKLTSPSKMIIAWSLTIISMLMELVAIYLIFLSFNLNQFGFILVSQIYLASLILGYISFLPNGIGITDGSFIGMLTLRNLDLAVATSVVLAVRFIGIWFKVSMGFIALKFLHIEKNNKESEQF